MASLRARCEVIVEVAIAERPTGFAIMDKESGGEQ